MVPALTSSGYRRPAGRLGNALQELLRAFAGTGAKMFSDLLALGRRVRYPAPLSTSGDLMNAMTTLRFLPTAAQAAPVSHGLAPGGNRSLIGPDRTLAERCMR
jgi:hypothetical protein